ncbi:MAG: PRC-barrel domain-containing protein [Steroidobacteraceae bacterium]
MLRNSQYLEGCTIGATDGPIGEVKDLYFDDKAWVIRYLVVSTGQWLSNRKVLISPYAIRQPQWDQGQLSATLTKEQVRNSPDIDTDKPISRQYEMQYLKYYRYPNYWGSTGLWGVGVNPNLMPMNSGVNWSADQFPQAEAERDEMGRREHYDSHLRSCNAVMKYHIRATDGDIGHVHSLLIDDETWAIRYLIVETSNWWLGHQVLIAPQWIEDVNWFDCKVSVALTRQAVKDAPPYEAAGSLDRVQEMGIHQHYGRPGYWAVEGESGAAGSRR